MWQIILKIFGLIIVLIGVVMVFDARIITKIWFSFGDQNEATSGMKILGVVFCLIGGIIVYCIK